MTDDRNVVLLVDDEDLFRMTLRAALEAQIPGVRVLEAGDGGGALEVLARERVDCVVTDLRMEGMSGVELWSEMLLRGHAAPTVVVSAWASTGPLLEDALECITKPVDLYLL